MVESLRVNCRVNFTPMKQAGAVVARECGCCVYVNAEEGLFEVGWVWSFGGVAQACATAGGSARGRQDDCSSCATSCNQGHAHFTWAHVVCNYDVCTASGYQVYSYVGFQCLMCTIVRN